MSHAPIRDGRDRFGPALALRMRIPHAGTGDVGDCLGVSGGAAQSPSRRPTGRYSVKAKCFQSLTGDSSFYKSKHRRECANWVANGPLGLSRTASDFPRLGESHSCLDRFLALPLPQDRYNCRNSRSRKEVPVKTPSSTLWCALIPLLLLAPSPASPQDKPGTVKADSLAVYSKMSTDGDVVKTLAKGTVVRILFTATGEEGSWCSIASQDGSSRIGYVPCSGLDRPKDIPAMADQGGPLPEILIGESYTPVQTSKRQAHGSEEVGPAGQTIAPLPGYRWSSYPKTLVIAIRRGCPFCDASLPFYRQLGEQERSNVLRAHVLVVMPNDVSSGSGFLRKDDVEVQGIFGQNLDALRVSGTPTVLLLDSSGRIERAWIGQLTPRGEKEVMNAAEE